MEALMQYVWQFRLWPVQQLKTTDGRRVQVLDPGLHNHDAGPDFFNAKVIIGGEHWAGNVEIHVRASDWYRHHHDTDPNYDSVVLHIVEYDDAQIQRPDGQVIPQLVMKCAPDFSKRYHDMVNNPLRELPCGDQLSKMPQIYVTDWLTSVGFDRLYAKADRVLQYLRTSDYSWTEAIYITLARALGFGVNSDPFELLAQTTPLKNILHHADSVLAIEALLLGQAGLLEGLNPGEDRYLNRLLSEYQFLSTKYSLKRSPNIRWKMSRMRPQNSPHRRIAALAQLLFGEAKSIHGMLELQSMDEARSLFDIQLYGFWASHYNFTALEDTHSAKAFGAASIDVLLINVVVPVIFAYALSTGDLRRQEFAVDMLHHIRPEANRIVEIYRHAGLTPADAFVTQALIQLRREYCEPRKCLFCRLGHRLLSQKVPR